MTKVDPSMPTYERFLLAAELLGISPRELAARLESPMSVGMPSPAQESDPVSLHANYLGHRIEAIYDRAENRVTILNGDLAGTTYGSASSAAIAVVEMINPERESANTNGRLFWIVNDTGKPLRSLLGQR